MKVFLLVALCVSAASARGVTSWNSLLKAEVLSSEVDAVRSRSGHQDVLLQELSGLLNDPNVLDKAYNNFLSLFNKNEESLRDFEAGVAAARQETFKSNLLAIAKHNLEADAGTHTWSKGVNQFADLTSQEFHRIYTPSLLNFTAALESSGIRRVPLQLQDDNNDAVDWREKNKVTKVKDQGQCGSCYAFATIGALESSCAIKGDTDATLDLSEQEVVSCSKNSGCNGGFWYASYDYMKNGVTSEANYAYTSGKSKAAGSCNSRKRRTKVAKVSEYALTTENDESEMLKALAEKGPLAVAVCTGDWQFYRGGVFEGHCENDGGNVDHAVIAVAYTDSTIVIKNSWAESWGDQGYITLQRGVNHCNVAKYPCWVNCA